MERDESSLSDNEEEDGDREIEETGKGVGLLSRVLKDDAREERCLF